MTPLHPSFSFLRRLGALAALVGAGLISPPNAANAAAVAAAGPLAGIDAEIEAMLEPWSVPGVAVGAIQNGKVVYARGFGVRELGKTARVDEKTLFQIGSLTKAFASTSLGALVDDGKLRWDDAVVDRLPAFQAQDPWLTRQITVRDIVSHRTGIEASYPAVSNISGAELLRRIRYVTPRMRFRDQYLYSNLMYRVAGQVGAAVAGTSWDELVQTRIFKPLRMTSSVVSPYEIWDRQYVAPMMYGEAPAGKVGYEQSRVPNVAMNHLVTPSGIHTLPWQSLGESGSSGSIGSNVEDLLNWLQFHLQGGMFDGKRVMAEATVREMQSPQMLAPRPDDEMNWRAIGAVSPSTDRPAYAMGWRCNTYRGSRYIHHSGALLGCDAFIAMMPEKGLGAVVLANSWGRGGKGWLNDVVTLRIFDALLGAPVHDWEGDFRQLADARDKSSREMREAPLKQRPANAVPPRPLASYAGEYENELVGRVKVELRDGRLYFGIPGLYWWEMEHWQSEVFRVQVRVSGADSLPWFATFRTDPKGDVAGLTAGWVMFGPELTRVAPR